MKKTGIIIQFLHYNKKFIPYLPTNQMSNPPSTTQSPTLASAMLFAAGIGSRLKPWTDNHPKALAIVNGKSLLQRNITYLQQHHIFNVVINVHHFAEQIIEALEKNKGWGSQFSISDESDDLLETGGGLVKAAPLLSHQQPIVMLNADMLTNADIRAMLTFHNTHNPLATLATSNRISSRSLFFDSDNKLCGWRNNSNKEEKGTISGNNLMACAFNGLHIIDPNLFSLITIQGKFSIMDVYLKLMSTHAIKSFDCSLAKVIDVGKPESIKQAEALFD